MGHPANRGQIWQKGVIVEQIAEEKIAMNIRLLAVLSGCALAGCGGVSHVVETYGSISSVPVQTPEDTFQVFDRPDKGTMMVNPSIGVAAAHGATFGLAGSAKPGYQRAAEQYLANTGRASCVIVDGYEVLKPQWEFKYRCDGGSARG
ncbi:MAG: hypothetical protein C0519_08895 [Hyphomicrobium sp.]|nr:hypothetical protein [Hyphomicrobium sp.]PPD06461.1 MAG: hypothetical protein CTY28_13735 [Hyphomicrobium sp.]